MNLRDAAYRLAVLLSSGLPSRMSLRLAARIADWQYRRAAAVRAAVRANLTLVIGERPPEDSPLIRDVFRNFAYYLVEFLHAHRYPRLPVEIEGGDRLSGILASGKGGIVLTAHLGNWELGAIALSRLGLPMHVVALPHGDPRMNAFFDRQRQRCGVSVVPVGAHATRQCLRILRRGELLGIVGDHEFGPNGVSVSFLGRAVELPRGPAILSLRTGAPVVPTFLIREDAWRFRLYLEEPIYPPQHSCASRDTHDLTQTYAAVLARYIQRFPTQWGMFEPIARATSDGAQPIHEPSVVCGDSRL